MGYPIVTPDVFTPRVRSVPAVVATEVLVPALPEVRSFTYVVKYAGTPMLRPFVLRVPTIFTPAVVAVVNPVPAPAAPGAATEIANPLLSKVIEAFVALVPVPAYLLES